MKAGKESMRVSVLSARRTEQLLYATLSLLRACKYLSVHAIHAKALHLFLSTTLADTTLYAQVNNPVVVPPVDIFAEHSLLSVLFDCHC